MYIFFLKRNCFLFFFIILSKKVVWPQKLYPRYFRRYSKDLSQEFEKKNQFLLIFDDFGEKLHFWPNFWICEEHCWGHKIVGNRQTQKKIFFQVEKFMENMFDILKYASECQIDAIFVIKICWLLGTKSQKILPWIYRSL